MWLLNFSLLLLLLLSPLLQIRLGGQLVQTIGVKCFGKDFSLAPGYAVLLMIGLLISLVLSLLLKCLGVPWLPAVLLPYALPLAQPAKLLQMLRDFPVKPGANFILWFTAVLFSGLSLFYSHAGNIATPWKNNYGDLTFHLGIITNFINNDTFPPDYQIFPAVKLSYPFLVNFWSAAFWQASGKFSTLAFIFLFQWVLIWTVIFYLLDGNRMRVLPWALLLGGGSYLTIGSNSGELIPQNVPWTVFFTTIWVPQRSAFFGAACLLAAYRVFFSGSGSREQRVFFSALILALSALAHTHFMMTGFAVLGALVIADAVGASLLQEPRPQGSTFLRDLGWCALGFIPVLAAVPLLIGKTGLISMMPGWSSAGGDKTIFTSLDVWFRHASPWLAAMLLVWVLTRAHRFFLSLLLVFLAANIVLLAEWDWDQIKVFLALYVIFFAFCAARQDEKMTYLQYTFFMLLIPGLIEVSGVIKEGPDFEVYSAQEVQLASQIVRETWRGDIIAAAPDHNSPVTLTGRTMFMGYAGTLGSHQIDYRRHEKLMESPETLARCGKQGAVAEVNPAVCPRYLLWTAREKNYWKRETPGDIVHETNVPGLYKFNP